MRKVFFSVLLIVALFQCSLHPGHSALESHSPSRFLAADNQGTTTPTWSCDDQPANYVLVDRGLLGVKCEDSYRVDMIANCPAVSGLQCHVKKPHCAVQGSEMTPDTKRCEYTSKVDVGVICRPDYIPNYDTKENRWRCRTPTEVEFCADEFTRGADNACYRNPGIEGTSVTCFHGTPKPNFVGLCVGYRHDRPLLLSCKGAIVLDKCHVPRSDKSDTRCYKGTLVGEDCVEGSLWDAPTETCDDGYEDDNNGRCRRINSVVDATGKCYGGKSLLNRRCVAS